MLFKSLVVCADENASQILRRVLKELDIDSEFHSLSEAVQSIADERFDIVVVDCQNPQPAIEFMRKVRASALNGAALAVAILETGSDVKPLFAVSTNFVLYKPISLERAQTSLQAARSLV